MISSESQHVLAQGYHGPNLRIPGGWEDCPPYGGVVEGTNIIPMKVKHCFLIVPYNHFHFQDSAETLLYHFLAQVPLDSRYDHMLDLQTRWTPQEVVNTFLNHGTPVKVVFDLTAGRNYYNASEFEQLGVYYRKVRDLVRPYCI